MLAQYTSALIGIPAVNRPDSRVFWPIVTIGCLSCLFVYWTLFHLAPILVGLFSGLGAALPLPTRIDVAGCVWLCPVLCLRAPVLAIAKQFVQLCALPFSLANLQQIFVGAVFAPPVALTIELPWFVLIPRPEGAQ